MMQKRLFAIAALAVALLTPSSSSAAAPDIKVTPEGHLVTLTPSQSQELRDAIEIHLCPNPFVCFFGPDYVNAVFNQAISIDLKDATNLVITVTENTPGTILPCLAVVIPTDGNVSASADAKHGDAEFSNPPTKVELPSGGVVFVFHGTPSEFGASKLHITLNVLL